MITIKQVTDGITKFYSVAGCEFIPTKSPKYSVFYDSIFAFPHDGFPENPDSVWYAWPDDSSTYSSQVKFTERNTGEDPVGVLKMFAKSADEVLTKFDTCKFFYEGDSLSIITNGVMIDLIE